MASTRIRLAKTQNVVAVAKMKDGSIYRAIARGEGHNRRVWRLEIMAKIKPRVKVPKKAEAGEIVTIKTLISHPDGIGPAQGQERPARLIPQDIVNHFKATL